MTQGPAGGAYRSVGVRAPAKVNLGLEVVGRRADGYHELLTVFQAVGLFDELRLAPSKRPGVRLRVLPRRLDLGLAEDNLATRAAQLFLERFGGPPGLDLEVCKRIPAGAGFGGGSSDAAGALLGLRHMTNGPRSEAELRPLASALGSDVAFFLGGGLQLGRGRGDQLRALVPGVPRTLVLVFPNVAVPTSSVYSQVRLPLTPPGPLRRILQRGNLDSVGAQVWAGMDELRNDLQPIVSNAVPSLARILDLGRSLGASTVRVTGSGSGVYCVAPDGRTARTWSSAFRSEGYWSRSVETLRTGCVVRWTG